MAKDTGGKHRDPSGTRSTQDPEKYDPKHGGAHGSGKHAAENPPK